MRVAQVLDTVKTLGRRAADHAVNLLALLEQKFGEVKAVLAVMPVPLGLMHVGSRDGTRLSSSVGSY